jgi:hypothetical protein
MSVSAAPNMLRTWLPLLIPLFILQLGLMIFALIDLARREKVKGGNKVVWALVILLINTIGPLVYFLFGREEE